MGLPAPPVAEAADGLPLDDMREPVRVLIASLAQRNKANGKS